MAWPHCPVPGCGKATGVSEAAGAGLKKCKRCLRVMYCSKSCQVAAWKGGHKHECKPPQQARVGTGAAAAGDDASLAAAAPAPKDYASSPVTSSLPPWLAGLSIGPDEVAASIRTLYDMGLHRDVLQREEEGLAAAEELRSKNPENAVMIYSMLGVSFDMCCEPDKGLGLLEQAKALATEGGDREALGESCIRLGVHHMGQGDAEKAIVVLQQAKSIAMEIGQRLGEAETNLFLGISFMYLKQFDRAIDLLEQSVAVHKELRRPRGLANARVNLGRCLSVHGQHDRAIACLKQAWFGYEELGNPDELPRAAVRRGEVLWEHARAEHLQAAPDATSFGGVSAAVAGRLKSAETWLLMGLELAGEVRIINLKMDAVIHLACVAMLKGDEDEAINHLAQFLHWWLELAPKTCSACGRERRESTQLMTCDGCRVARYCCPAHQRMSWKGQAEQSYGVRHKDICPLLKQWRLLANGHCSRHHHAAVGGVEYPSTPECREALFRKSGWVGFRDLWECGLKDLAFSGPNGAELRELMVEFLKVALSTPPSTYRAA